MAIAYDEGMTKPAMTTSQIVLLECARCEMPLAPELVPENGVCPGCGGMFFQTPQPSPRAAAPQLARAVPKAAAPAKKSGSGALIAGGIAAVVAVGIGFAAFPKRNADAPSEAELKARAVAAQPAQPPQEPKPAPKVAAPVIEQFAPVSFGTAATADTRVGLFRSRENTHDLIHPLQFGRLTLEGIPFEIISPEAAPGGKNAIALRGGFENARTAYPKEVELPLSGPVTKLHVLNGGGGWAWPWSPSKTIEAKRGGKVVRLTVHWQDGTSTSQEMLNGIAIADHVHKGNLSGAKSIEGVLENKLARLSTYDFGKGKQAKSLTVEGYEGDAVPVLLAITAEMAR